MLKNEKKSVFPRFIVRSTNFTQNASRRRENFDDFLSRIFQYDFKVKIELDPDEKLIFSKILLNFYI